MFEMITLQIVRALETALYLTFGAIFDKVIFIKTKKKGTNNSSSFVRMYSNLGGHEYS